MNGSPVKKKSKKKRIAKDCIGWLEYVDFPDWKIKGVTAKVDTGAKTSSLDVDHIEILSGNRVHFNVVLSKKPTLKKVSLTAKLSRIAKVKSSPIHHEERVFVKTKIVAGPFKKEIEINLIDRSNMVYRMLLGRSAIKDCFLVDVAHKYVLSKKTVRSKSPKEKC